MDNSSLPLRGKTVLITRRIEQSGELRDLLVKSGAMVEFLPTIQVVPLEQWDACDAVLERLKDFDLIVFASVNAVTFFLHRCVALGIAPDALASLELAAVGRRTAVELERLKLPPQHVPDEYSAAGLVNYFSAHGVAGRRVLVPRGNLGKEELVEGLRRLGAHVESVVVYQTVAPHREGTEETLERIFQDGVDVITFASPSAVHNFAALLPDGTLQSVQGHVAIAVIGPTTMDAVREAEGGPAIMAEQPTAYGLTAAIVEYYRQ